MAYVFHGNFDFEHELSSSSYNRPRRLERLNAELATHLLALARDEDHLIFPCEPPEGFLSEAADAGFPQVQADGPVKSKPQELKMNPWGWSDAVVKLAKSYGGTNNAPPVSAVRAANCRRFSYELEQTERFSFPGCAIVDSLDALEIAVFEAAAIWNRRPDEFDWLLKAEYSMSGRERITGRGVYLTDSSGNWIRRRLQTGERLYFEPGIVSLFELSTQWNLGQPASHVGESPAPELIGITQLLTDGSGQYLGSAFVDVASPANFFSGLGELSQSSDLLNRAVADARAAALDVQRLGYFGPLGIDAMIYQGPDGTPSLRSVQDVNARLTMGRLALEWFQRFPGSGQPAWLLVPDGWFRDGDNIPSPENPVRRLTSPRFVAGQPVQRVGVLMTDRTDWQRLLAIHL